jgi:monoamine oxidase
MAGLCAAFELERRGCEVVLLEADAKHHGGRVRTARFDDGQYGELGAMRIPASHELTRRYIAHFGLDLRKFVQTNPLAYAHVRGHRARIGEIGLLKPLFDLTPEERGLGLEGLWARGVTEAFKTLSPGEQEELLEPVFHSPALRRFDRLSLRDLFLEAGLSPDALELLASCWGLETQLISAATEHLREELTEVWIEEFDEIVGGTDTLAKRFVDALSSKPRNRCEVFRLEQSADRVAAVYNRDGGEEREEGDFLICTAPLPVLARMEVRPDFSGAKQRAIRQIGYDSSSKILARYGRRFWELDDGIYGGGSVSDRPTVFTYYPSDNVGQRDRSVSEGPGVVLASYTWGQSARRLGPLPFDDQEAEAIRGLERLHPQIRHEPGLFEGTRSWSWDNFKWSGGAFAWFSPGQHSDLHQDLIRPEGRILLAGEHASLAHTWIQGALESALNAVVAVLRRPSPSP